MPDVPTPRILIVEDDYHISRIIQLALAQLDVPYALDTALSAEEGFALWQTQPYDLLLTDYNLRGMSGLKLVNALKATGSTAPIIMVTAYDTPQLEREARAAGISAYVPKPFLIDELLDVIRRFLPNEERVISS